VLTEDSNKNSEEGQTRLLQHARQPSRRLEKEAIKEEIHPLQRTNGVLKTTSKSTTLFSMQLGRDTNITSTSPLLIP
jgi:hypothetical protein